MLEIGDNVVVGGFAQITCHIFEGRELTLGKVKIGDNTLISAEAFIMPGVTIGKNCNIGICSFVRKNRTIPDGIMTMAIPGISPKKVAEITKEERKHTIKKEEEIDEKIQVIEEIETVRQEVIVENDIPNDCTEYKD